MQKSLFERALLKYPFLIKDQQCLFQKGHLENIAPKSILESNSREQVGERLMAEQWE